MCYLVDIRDFFEPGGSDRVLNLLRKFSEETTANHDMLITTLTLARTVVKTENNKCKCMM